VTFMSTTRTARRIITISASAALIATAPGFIGVASANDTPSPKPASSHAQVTLSPTLVTAIQSARATFKTTARSATDTYRSAKSAIRTAMQSDANLTKLHADKDAAKQALEAAHKAGTATPALQSAYDTARSAFDAAKVAYEAAKAPYRAQETAASSALSASIDAAKAVYVSAVKAAFATYAPGVTVPDYLIQVSDRHHGFAFGHLNDKPNKAGSLHMVGSRTFG
jgi:hypothetical protein